MSSAARARSSIESAPRSTSITCRIDTRCSAKRSRSLTTPLTRPPSTTTTWRMPRSAITCIASCAVAPAGSVTTGVVITSASGCRSGSLGQHDAPQQVDQREHADRARRRRRRRRSCAPWRRASPPARRAPGRRPCRSPARGAGARPASCVSDCCSAARWPYWTASWASDCLERLGDRLRAEPLELGRSPPQLQEVVARQDVAERVLHARGRSWSSAPPADSAPTGKSSPGPSVGSGSARGSSGRLPTRPRWTMCRCSTGPDAGARIVASFGEVRERQPRDRAVERVVGHPRRTARGGAGRRASRRRAATVWRSSCRQNAQATAPARGGGRARGSAVAHRRQCAAAFAARMPVFWRT